MQLREFFVKGMLRAFPHLQRRLEMANAYQVTFGSPEGKLVLRDLLKEAGVLTTPFTGGGSEETHFNVGRQAMGLHVIARLRWSEGELMTLAQETTFEQLTEQERELAA